MSRPFTLLLLAGTAETRDLAGRLSQDECIRTIASLAGVTARPLSLDVETRSGGFGGIEGLTDYLRKTGVDGIIDATHPFAARINSNAVAACKATAAFRMCGWNARSGRCLRAMSGMTSPC
ncbi:precorrin-6A/cobalt-precorrin-6A reductase [Breoghania sp.]|uniref:precorrin-6A/cobalt-precorrin-6A reductase n=1 Tax=Breoghania sp. TaxID=2065378 RepID=UPI00262E2A03|nr:precorrin-6A/cobalt-precorrin-6A reductase [Breoghania sp.]MDJ0930950.1 precorrin-6A/cobalt-precorrin-6A reductase [Breoghania sp.]